MYYHWNEGGKYTGHLLIGISHPLRVWGLGSPVPTNILAHKPKKPFCRNLFHASHHNKDVWGYPLKVKQGHESRKLKPSRELGEIVSPGHESAHSLQLVTRLGGDSGCVWRDLSGTAGVVHGQRVSTLSR